MHSDWNGIEAYSDNDGGDGKGAYAKARVPPVLNTDIEKAFRFLA